MRIYDGLYSEMFGVSFLTAAYQVSCMMFKLYSDIEGLETATIDPDGSGPLAPFKVSCDKGK